MPPASPLRRGLAAAAVAAALAPSAALAQSAGDDQYSDPFGGEQAATATPSPKAAAPAATAAPAQSAPAPAAAAPAAAAAAPAAAPALPYTGLDAWPLALTGALALGAGIALRVSLREHD